MVIATSRSPDCGPPLDVADEACLSLAVALHVIHTLGRKPLFQRCVRISHVGMCTQVIAEVEMAGTFRGARRKRVNLVRAAARMIALPKISRAPARAFRLTTTLRPLVELVRQHERKVGRMPNG